MLDVKHSILVFFFVLVNVANFFRRYLVSGSVK